MEELELQKMLEWKGPVDSLWLLEDNCCWL